MGSLRDEPLDVLDAEAVPAVLAEANRLELAVGDELADRVAVKAVQRSDLRGLQETPCGGCGGGHPFLLVEFHA
jgi:hypothetical protein